jgi:hypothetical protein
LEILCRIENKGNVLLFIQTCHLLIEKFEDIEAHLEYLSSVLYKIEEQKKKNPRWSESSRTQINYDELNSNHHTAKERENYIYTE